MSPTWWYENTSLEGIVQHFPIEYPLDSNPLDSDDEIPLTYYSTSKRPREDALDTYPKGAKALKTLDDEGVLNGYRANFAGMEQGHYKNKGVANGIAEETAKYMLHSNIEDRRRWCEKLVTGNTSICSVVEVIEAYRQAQATLTHQNTIDARGQFGYGSRVLVIDSNGVIH